MKVYFLIIITQLKVQLNIAWLNLADFKVPGLNSGGLSN